MRGKKKEILSFKGYLIEKSGYFVMLANKNRYQHSLTCIAENLKLKLDFLLCSCFVTSCYYYYFCLYFRAVCTLYQFEIKQHFN